MRLKYLPALIMLIAGAIISIINIIHKVETFTALKRLLLVLVLFYILGLTAKALLEKALLEKPMEEQKEEDGEETSQNPQEKEEEKKEKVSVESSDRKKENREK
ncbi:MAG TPA: hypothetical protein DEP17_02060 [Lachnospiraceae bacterium]|jgi:choline-glycine betaine transporter|nr:hypothetical protein [Lachnospiraceae bacterium]